MTKQTLTTEHNIYDFKSKKVMQTYLNEIARLGINLDHYMMEFDIKELEDNYELFTIADLNELIAEDDK
jgi:hypothetical protein|tara:strand:- start:1654 stop:1860 length:207 start_codon:yes stop_codon:yes gene_type:complete